MPAIIDSAPDCVVHDLGAEPADDSADFIIQAPYQAATAGVGPEDCAGFMTFGPGSTYGPEGEAANTAYMVLTWIGIAVMVAALIAWVLYENRHLLAYAATRVGRRGAGAGAGGGA
jgi:hypothetical protein